MSLRLIAATIASAVCLLAFASSAPAAKTKDCGTHHYRSGDSFNVFARGVSCTFAVKHVPASYNRHRCPKGWKFRMAQEVQPRCVRGSAYLFGSPTDDM